MCEAACCSISSFLALSCADTIQTINEVPTFHHFWDTREIRCMKNRQEQRNFVNLFENVMPFFQSCFFNILLTFTTTSKNRLF